MRPGLTTTGAFAPGGTYQKAAAVMLGELIRWERALRVLRPMS